MIAHAMSGDREKSLEAGMDDHLTKPIDPEILKNALLRWMPEGRGQKPEIRRRTSDVGHRTSDPQVSDFSSQPSLSSPFNIPAALKRCNNKPELLRKLFLFFVAEFADAGFRLRALLQDSQSENALILAHSLKGVAATLEARELSEVAKAVEFALRNGETGNLEALLRSLDLVLTPAVEAASSLAEQAEVGQSPTSDSSTSRTSISDLHVVLESLRKQIEANNLSARKSFTDVRGDLMGRGVDELVTGLEENLGKLDFSAALSRLNDIVASLGKNRSDMKGDA